MEPGKLFVGGISWDTNEDRLRDYFQTFGEVVEAVIMKDRATGRARGFGFVIFADPAVADRVVRQKHIIDGRTVEAKKAVPRDDQHMVISRNHGSPIASPVLCIRTKKIFVGGLACTVTEGDLKRYFDQFGIITDVVVMYDHNTQRPRGFGFITFDSEEAVDRALINNFHELHGKMVEVKRAVPKELSPGPIRSPLGGGTAGLSKVNGFLNGYVQGYIPSPIGGHGVNHSPMSFARGGFPPFSPSGYGTALNYEPSMSPKFGEPENLFRKLNFEQGLSVLHSSNTNRKHNSSEEFDGISRSSSSTLGSSWSLWGNMSINDSTFCGNTSSLGFRAGDVEVDTFKHSEVLWNSNRHSSVGLNLNYGREEANLGYAEGLYDRDHGTLVPTPTSTFASLDGIYDAKFDSFNASGNERPWPLSSSGLKGSGSFEVGLGNAASDVPLNNLAGLCW